MSVKVIFRRDARAEFAAAVRYYETQADGLGQRFKDEVLAKIALVQEIPERFGLYYRDAR
jgi:hypothetical protein